MSELSRFSIVLAIILLFLSRTVSSREASTFDVPGKPYIINQFSELGNRVKSHVLLLQAVMITQFEDCDRCIQGNQVFEQFAAESAGTVLTSMVDCKQIWNNPSDRVRVPACDPHAESLPHLSFFVPDLLSFDLQSGRMPRDIPYSGIVSVEALQEKSRELMPSFVKNVNNESELKDFLDSRDTQFKFLLFSSEDTAPMYFKALSCSHKGNVALAFVDGDNKRLKKAYKVTKLPFLLLLTYNANNEYEQEVYEEEISIQKLDAYLQDQFQRKSRSNSNERPARSSEFPSTSQEITEIQIRSNQIDHALKKNKDNLIVMILFKGQKVASTHKSAGIYSKIKGDLHNLAVYYQVQCSNNECDRILKQANINSKISSSDGKQNTLEYPAVVVFGLAVGRDANVIAVDKILDKQQLAEVLLGKMNSEQLHYGEQQSAQELQNSVQRHLSNQRFACIFFVDKFDYLSRLTQVIVSQQRKYQKIIEFVTLLNPTQQEMDTWKVESSPGVVVVLELDSQNNRSYRRAPFDDTQFTYQNIINYLNPQAIQKQDQIFEAKPLDIITNYEEFEKLCYLDEEGQRNSCVIGLFDGSKGGKMKMDLDKLKQVRRIFAERGYRFGYIDANCHRELLGSLRINEEQLNTMLFFDSQKEKYRLLKEPFEIENLVRFFDGMKGKLPKGMLSPLPSSIEIDERDCKAFNVQMKQKLEEERKKKIERKYSKINSENGRKKNNENESAQAGAEEAESQKKVEL